MIRVECINTKGLYGGLVTGCVYEVEKEIDRYYVIRINKGIVGYYLKKRFKKVGVNE